MLNNASKSKESIFINKRRRTKFSSVIWSREARVNFKDIVSLIQWKDDTIYRVIRVAKGMGAVYLAVDSLLDW